MTEIWGMRIDWDVLTAAAALTGIGLLLVNLFLERRDRRRDEQRRIRALLREEEERERLWPRKWEAQ